jgi:type I restriction enzyme S subunit
MSAVSETTKTITSPETRKFGHVRKGYTPMRNGDVIVAKITPCFENGKLAIVNLEQSLAFGSTEFHVFRPTGEVDSRLLYHLLSSDLIQKEGRNQMKGAAGQKRVPSDFFRAFEFRVPRSLPEQKRIAAILDKADAIRRKLRQSLRLSDDFLRSVFLDMFGDPVTNPKGLPRAALGDIIKLKSGNSLVARDMTEGGLYPVYGGNGINGYHDSYMFEKRMIVLGRVGAYCGVVHYTLPQSWITDNALYVESLKKKMDSIYLVNALRFANLNQYAGQAGQPLISGGRVYPVEILDPSPDLQASYAAIVTKTQTKIQKSTALLQEAETLFSSLQQRAFRGEL